jgi:hypothetical protein
MRPALCVVSVAEHIGWAHLICVAARRNVPAVIARRRVALIDRGLPTMPYEHDTTALREDEANGVIARVRRSIAARTSDALRRVVSELAPAHTAVALAIREPPFDDLPATVAAVGRPIVCSAPRTDALSATSPCGCQLELDVHMCRRGRNGTAAQPRGDTGCNQFVSRAAGRPARRDAGAPPGAAGIAALAPHARGPPDSGAMMAQRSGPSRCPVITTGKESVRQLALVWWRSAHCS